MLPHGVPHRHVVNGIVTAAFDVRGVVDWDVISLEGV